MGGAERLQEAREESVINPVRLAEGADRREPAAIADEPAGGEVAPIMLPLTVSEEGAIGRGRRRAFGQEPMFDTPPDAMRPGGMDDSLQHQRQPMPHQADLVGGDILCRLLGEELRIAIDRSHAGREGSKRSMTRPNLMLMIGIPCAALSRMITRHLAPPLTLGYACIPLPLPPSHGQKNRTTQRVIPSDYDAAIMQPHTRGNGQSCVVRLVRGAGHPWA